MALIAKITNNKIVRLHYSQIHSAARVDGNIDSPGETEKRREGVRKRKRERKREEAS